MPIHSHSSRSKKKWIVGLFLFLAVCIFYKPLAVFGCKTILHLIFPKTAGRVVSYERIGWEKDQIAIVGLCVQDSTSEITIDRVEVKLTAEFSPLCFSPQLTLIHPQIALSSSSQDQLPLPFLYRSRFVAPKWEIRNGVVILDSSSRFYISMLPIEEKLGHLTLSYDPDLSPLFSADLVKERESLKIHFQLEEQDAARIFPLISLFAPQVSRKWEQIAGELSCQGVLTLDPSLQMEKLEWRGVGKKIELRDPSDQIRFACDEIDASFSYPIGEEEMFWQRVNGSISLIQAAASFGAIEVKEIVGVANIEPGKELQMTLKGICHQLEQQLFFILTGTGSIQSDHTFWSQAALLCQAASGKQMEGKLSFMQRERDLLLQLEVLKAQAEHLDFCRSLFNLPGECLEAEASFAATLLLHEGQLQNVSIDQSSLEKFCWHLPEENLFFTAEHLSVESLFSSHQLAFQIGGEELKIIHPQVEVTLAHLDPTTYECIQDQNTHEWQGQIPLSQIKVYECAHGCTIENMSGMLAYKASRWNWKGNFDLLQLPFLAVEGGKCELFFDSDLKQIGVERAEGIWRLRDGLHLSLQFQPTHFLLSDQNEIPFSLKVAEEKREYACLEGKIHSTSIGGWEILFDSTTTHLGGTKLDIRSCEINDQMELVRFEMHPLLICEELAEKLTFLQNTDLIPLDFSFHLLEEWELEGKVQTHIFSTEGFRKFSFEAEAEKIKVQGKAYDAVFISGEKIEEKWFIKNFSTKQCFLKGIVVAESNGYSVPFFEGNWLGVSMKGNGYLRSEQKQVHCTLESARLDLASLLPESSLKGICSANGSFVLDYSDASLPFHLTGDTNLFIDLQTPLLVNVSSGKPIHFTYREQEGFAVEETQWKIKEKPNDLILAEVRTKQIVSSTLGEYLVHSLQFSSPPVLLARCIDAKLLPSTAAGWEWEGNFEGSGDLSIGIKGVTFQGNLKPGFYGIQGKKLPFEQIQIRLEKELFSARIKTKIQEAPLWAALQIRLEKEPSGMIKIFDDLKKEGLKILFTTQKGKWMWESIQGECYGLTCNLVKNTKHKVASAEILTGKIQIAGDSLLPLFPSELAQNFEQFQIGKGYEWEGELLLFQEEGKGFQLNGALRGSEFEILGYTFQKLEGVLEATQNKILISHLKMEDPAGKIGIEKIEMTKQGEWNLFIPKIAVQKLQPSIMRRVDGQLQEIKPFTIQQFTLTDVRAKLGEMNSLEGSGHLRFVNQFKKENSIFDTPMELIKKIGLDPGLLTPIQGELEMELRGDKFYLLSLQNAFSEGNRSEFYLAAQKNLSYIDLNGKMHIDLKMHQDVVLKITEPLTLTIRGTLEKPRYGLQY